MSELENDIEKRILDRLSVWLNDSFALCEMGNLRSSTSAAIVMRALLWALISGFIQKGAKKDDLLDVVDTNWDLVWKAKSRLENGE